MAGLRAKSRPHGDRARVLPPPEKRLKAALVATRPDRDEIDELFCETIRAMLLHRLKEYLGRRDWERLRLLVSYDMRAALAGYEKASAPNARLQDIIDALVAAWEQEHAEFAEAYFALLKARQKADYIVECVSVRSPELAELCRKKLA